MYISEFCKHGDVLIFEKGEKREVGGMPYVLLSGDLLVKEEHIVAVVVVDGGTCGGQAGGGRGRGGGGGLFGGLRAEREGGGGGGGDGVGGGGDLSVLARHGLRVGILCSPGALPPCRWPPPSRRRRRAWRRWRRGPARGEGRSPW